MVTPTTEQTSRSPTNADYKKVQQDLPPTTSRRVMCIGGYVYCHELEEPSVIKRGVSSNMCSLVGCTGAEIHTPIYTEMDRFVPSPYGGDRLAA